MEKVMSNKSQWLIIGLVVAIALIAIALSQYQNQKIKHNVAALKQNFAAAQNEQEGWAAWQGFVAATSPTLEGKQASAGFFSWFGCLFKECGGGTMDKPAGMDPWWVTPELNIDNTPAGIEDDFGHLEPYIY